MTDESDKTPEPPVSLDSKATEHKRRWYQYSLRSLMIVMILFCFLFAWIGYKIREAGRTEIIGSWQYPTDDVTVLGYSTTLDINRDGKFRKEQAYRSHTETYTGTFSINKDGTIDFHVTTRTFDYDFNYKLDTQGSETKMVKGDPEVTKVDATFVFRCAIDKTGYLIFSDVVPFRSNDDEDIGIEWETYMPNTSK